MFIRTQTVQKFRMFPLTPDPIRWRRPGNLWGRCFPKCIMFWSFRLQCFI